MTQPVSTRTAAGGSTNRVFRVLSLIERAGNKLPHPFWLFWILAAVLAVTSAVLAHANVPSRSTSTARKHRKPC